MTGSKFDIYVSKFSETYSALEYEIKKCIFCRSKNKNLIIRGTKIKINVKNNLFFENVI